MAGAFLVTLAENVDFVLTLGLRTALQILTGKLLDASERVQNIIRDFKYYAMADGLKEVLRSAMKPCREPKPPQSQHWMAIVGSNLQ